MFRTTILALFVGVFLLAQQGSETKSIVPIHLQRKVALVIGNADYQHIPQREPAIADANDMAAALRALHFDTVDVQTNLNAEALIQAINRFSRSQVGSGDLAVIYYSGHGGQAGEENYLLPIDYDPPSEDDLVERHGGYRMSRVRDVLEAQGARVRVLIFDACRNSPVVSTKAGVGGLKQMEGKPEGTFIAYASAHNQASRFQRGQRNSFYTAELLDALKNPDRDLESIFKQVQVRVYQRTDGVQRPYVYGFLSEPVYLGVIPVPRPPGVSADEEAWNAVRDSGRRDALEAFVREFPNSRYAGAARVKIAALPPEPVAQPPSNRSKVNPKDGLTYVWIPPGNFMMGCSPGDNECYSYEKPDRQVTVPKGFWLGESEVTQAAYQKVIGTSPSHFKGAHLPVDTISWNEAGAYCRAVGGRLPTEPEWEYAARAGSTEGRYGTLNSIAWYKTNSGSKTHSVMQKQPNAWGLYDMLGNVWEWMDGEGSPKPLRGGSWGTTLRIVRASNRSWGDPALRYDSVGFRCAWE